MAITITITHPDQNRTIVTGFNQLWAFYVRGFDPSTHCQKCLRGRRSRHVSRDATELGRELVFDECSKFGQVYLCGIASGPEALRKCHNLHLALTEHPGNEFELATYNDYRLLVKNAAILPIPEPLPALAHLGGKHYRCKNFRFGVEHYGYPGLAR